MNTIAALESAALNASAAFAQCDLLDAEAKARTAAEAFRNLAAAFRSAGQLADADNAEAIAEGAEHSAEMLATSPRIAEARRMRAALASLPR